jgi:hypothetical protein
MSNLQSSSAEVQTYEGDTGRIQISNEVTVTFFQFLTAADSSTLNFHDDNTATTILGPFC